MNENQNLFSPAVRTGYLGKKEGYATDVNILKREEHSYDHMSFMQQNPERMLYSETETSPSKAINTFG